MEFVLGAIFRAVAMAIAVAVSITGETENRIVNYTIVLTEEETADREPKKAHWTEDDIGYDPFLTCSECGLSLSKSDYTGEKWQEVFKYCSCCGANMREAKE